MTGDYDRRRPKAHQPIPFYSTVGSLLSSPVLSLLDIMLLTLGKDYFAALCRDMAINTRFIPLSPEACDKGKRKSVNVSHVPGLSVSYKRRLDVGN